MDSRFDEDTQDETFSLPVILPAGPIIVLSALMLLLLCGMMFASYEGAECALAMTNAGVDVDAAALRGCAELTHFLLDSDISTERGAALLVHACESNSPDTVRAVIAGITVEAFHFRDDRGATPLHHCARGTCSACCRVLLDTDAADQSVLDADGKLPEDVASSVRMFSVFQK